MAESQAAQVLLEIDRLTVATQTAHGRRAVLSEITLQVLAGETVAIVGESGAGKSTLIRAIIDALPDSLRIVSGGVQRTEGARRRGIAYIPQDPVDALNPVRTVGAQLTTRLRAASKERIGRAAASAAAIEALADVGIPDPSSRLNQYPFQLSGGIKQRVAVALGLVGNPLLIVADEPTSALDVIRQREIMDLLIRLTAQRQGGFLFVTHDMGVAVDYSDRNVVLKDGVVVEAGTTAELSAAPVSGYARELLELGRSNSAAVQRPALGPADTVPAGGRGAPAVEVAGLKKIFEVRDGRDVTAVDGVSFDVHLGETLAIVGQSGSGKTTIGRIILGTETATAGTVTLRDRAGEPVRRSAGAAYWRHIQPVYQNPDSALDPRWRVARIVGEPIRHLRPELGRRARSAEIEDLLAAVRLDPALAQRFPGELSGGQRQRVAIARALAAQPEVLVLDEAFSALDVVTQEQIVDLLKGLQRERSLTFLLISHDLGLVARFASRVVVLHRGRVVEHGPIDRVLGDPQDDYTRSLIDAVPGRSLVVEGMR